MLSMQQLTYPWIFSCNASEISSIDNQKKKNQGNQMTDTVTIASEKSWPEKPPHPLYLTRERD